MFQQSRGREAATVNWIDDKVQATLLSKLYLKLYNSCV